MYDRYIGLAGLPGDEVFFEWLYSVVARETAAEYKYNYSIEPLALASANSKFVIDYATIPDEDFEELNWQQHLMFTCGLLVRSLSAFEIIHYKGPLIVEKLVDGKLSVESEFNSELTKSHTTELVALAFAVSIAALEISLANMKPAPDGGKGAEHISIAKLRKMILTIVEDKNNNFTANGTFRRDFKMELDLLKKLLENQYQ